MTCGKHRFLLAALLLMLVCLFALPAALAADTDIPLTITAAQAGSTVKLNKVGSPTATVRYSTNGGSTWADYGFGTEITLENIGDTVSFKGTLSGTGYYSYLQFVMTGKTAASGNIMSLCSGDAYETATALPGEFIFCKLFSDCRALTDASALRLPATTLTDRCYESMFQGCENLTAAPDLPAAVLAAACYECMFDCCTSLTAAPDLPAAVLAENCYGGMFQGCTNLTAAPDLPAETLEPSCYKYMFGSCENLTTPPKIGAVQFAEDSCHGMFFYCKRLMVTNDPEKASAPYFKSEGQSYQDMFFDVALVSEANYNAEDGVQYYLARSFTVTFDTGGIGTAPDPVVAAISSTLTAPEVPAVDWYTVTAWYREADFRTPWNFDTDTVTEDITLYAKWEMNDPVFTLGGGTYVLGSLQSLPFRITGPADKLVRVLVDGSILDPANYTVASGSTILTLQPGYLETLAVGTHDITAVYTDTDLSGTAKTVSAKGQFTVAEAPPSPTPAPDPTPTPPKTGDGNTPLLWLTLLIAAGLAAGLIIRKRRV